GRRDDAPRLPQRGGGAGILRGIAARLRPGREGVPALRQDAQEDRAGGAKHLLLPRLPALTQGPPGDGKEAWSQSPAMATNSRSGSPLAFERMSRSPLRVQREVSWSAFRSFVS